MKQQLLADDTAMGGGQKDRRKWGEAPLPAFSLARWI